MPHSEIVVAPYRILSGTGALPEQYFGYREHARLVDELELDGAGDGVSFFGAGVQGDWPSLLVAQRYTPASAGFSPGLLLVPETGVVFIGAGTRLLAYALSPEPVRLWLDETNCGFWSWSRFGDVVLMSAELELAAWTTAGVKLWTAFVEPPWTYAVSGDVVELDVMGTESRFPLRTGPPRRDER